MKLSSRIILGLVIIGLVSTATVYALLLLLERKDPALTALSRQTPATIIQTYRSDSTTNQPSYTLTPPQPALQQMRVQSTNSSYAFNVDATSALQYVENDAAQAKNKEAVIETARSFFSNHGFTQQADATYFNVRYITYSGEQAVCQVIDNPASANLYAYYSVACADIAKIASQKAGIDALLALYPASSQLHIRLIQQNRLVSTDQTLITLQIATNDESKNTEIFYVTDITNASLLGSIDRQVVNGEVTSVQSPELKTSLNDPRYSASLSALLDK